MCVCVSPSDSKETCQFSLSFFLVLLRCRGAASISGLRCLTMTVQICCDIEKGRLLYVPANVQTEMCITHLNKVGASKQSVSF